MVSADMALPPTNARAVTGIGESDQLEARRGQDGRSVRITREKKYFWSHLRRRRSPRRRRSAGASEENTARLRPHASTVLRVNGGRGVNGAVAPARGCVNSNLKIRNLGTKGGSGRRKSGHTYDCWLLLKESKNHSAAPRKQSQGRRELDAAKIIPE